MKVNILIQFLLLLYVQDLKGAVSTISEFLERSLSEESLDLIVNNSTFSAMRSNPKTNPDLNPGELNKIPAQFFRKGKRFFTYFRSKTPQEITRKNVSFCTSLY